MEHQNREMRIMMDEIMPAFGEVIAIGQFTDVFRLEVFILTLFKPFESTFISHISTYLDVIAYLYIFD
uniref:Uncharacterized protein n=1 Tax=Rhodnius prolixus TaxID=13249 RepID=T1IEB6_RHOPR